MERVQTVRKKSSLTKGHDIRGQGLESPLLRGTSHYYADDRNKSLPMGTPSQCESRIGLPSISVGLEHGLERVHGP